ncbi:MAG: cytochrome-c oxidase [Limimaricola sp.]|uniref:hypothetical protein n=1 Tax=Limimaricola sp. TaxID=2211665 RepID=UPI001E0D2609|nr:hypothetical protein [Limimaricola sp.]MBI1415858.1 cytochrome-c oxidase [Limimaricola sp.]
MNVSRGFLVMGCLYLIAGISIGMYMGASTDHTLVPAHAHINLLGFTLMSVFGLVYRVVPAMAESGLATAHFWLHQVGTLLLVTMLVLLLTGRIAETAMFPVAPIAEVLVMLGVLSFAANLLRNGR